MIYSLPNLIADFIERVRRYRDVLGGEHAERREAPAERVHSQLRPGMMTSSRLVTGWANSSNDGSQWFRLRSADLFDHLL